MLPALVVRFFAVRAAAVVAVVAVTVAENLLLDARKIRCRARSGRCLKRCSSCCLFPLSLGCASVQCFLNSEKEESKTTLGIIRRTIFCAVRTYLEGLKSLDGLVALGSLKCSRRTQVFGGLDGLMNKETKMCSACCTAYRLPVTTNLAPLLPRDTAAQVSNFQVIFGIFVSRIDAQRRRQIFNCIIVVFPVGQKEKQPRSSPLQNCSRHFSTHVFVYSAPRAVNASEFSGCKASARA